MSISAITYDRILSIIGEVVRVALPPQVRMDPNGPRYGDLAVVREGEGEARLAQVVKLDPGEASLQVFGGQPLYVYGIQWLPVSEYLTYYGTDPQRCAEIYAGLLADTARPDGASTALVMTGGNCDSDLVRSIVVG